MAMILVLGATGYVSSRLIPLLAANGYAVPSLVRDKQKVAGAPWLRGEVVEGDVLKPELMACCQKP
jgi:uncharacterized protein YbjT (DUF2867 family)